MANLVIMKGVPASGKSTRARELVQQGYKRFNRDDMRAMMDSSKWSGENESYITEMQHYMIGRALRKGFNVVCDDTNLNVKVEHALRKIAAKNNAGVQVIFIDTPLKECLARDAARANPVGEDVVRRYHKMVSSGSFQVENHISAQEYEQCQPPAYDPTLPWCILVDIDGTLAHNYGHRGFYDWHKVGGDSVDNIIAGVVDKYYAWNGTGNQVFVVVMSGRDAVCRPETEDWLYRNDIAYHEFYMRAEGDSRKDSIVKRELFDNHIRGRYNVLFVLDDRNQVVDMWRNELGLTCLQVAEGDF